MLSIEIKKVVGIKRNPIIFLINVRDIGEYKVSNYVRGIRLCLRVVVRRVGKTDL